MNAPVLSRRHLLGATAAVGALSLSAMAEAGTPAGLPVDPDASLLDLIARHAEAERAVHAVEEEVDRRLLAAAAEHPPHPEALVWRPGDFPRTSYGHGAADEEDYDGRRRYRERSVEWLRRLKPPSVWTAEHEARRQEIIEAWDGWRATRSTSDTACRRSRPPSETPMRRWLR